MILLISLVFIATFIAGYFAGGAISNRKKKKADNTPGKSPVTTLTALQENKKKELLN